MTHSFLLTRLYNCFFAVLFQRLRDSSFLRLSITLSHGRVFFVYPGVGPKIYRRRLQSDTTHCNTSSACTTVRLHATKLTAQLQAVIVTHSSRLASKYILPISTQPLKNTTLQRPFLPVNKPPPSSRNLCRSGLSFRAYIKGRTHGLDSEVI